jgi:hypothetical protein
MANAELKIEEAVLAHPGTAAADELIRDVDAATRMGFSCDFEEPVEAVGGAMRTDLRVPWQVAEEASGRLRSCWGVQSGPLADSELLSLLKVDKHALELNLPAANSLVYGLRLKPLPGGARSSHPPLTLPGKPAVRTCTGTWRCRLERR